MTTPTGRGTRGRSTGGATGARKRTEQLDPDETPGSGSEYIGPVAKATLTDLKRLKRRAPDLATGTLAASMMAMAHAIDAPMTSPTSKSMCARVLLDTFDRLLVLAPVDEEGDELDDLSARRSERLAGSAGAKG